MMLDLIPLALFDAAQFYDFFINHATYLFIFLFMTIESSFIPFPSEIVVPPAAYLACTNTGAGADMNIYLVVVFATLGALAGAFINYYLSLWIGRPLVYKFADSHVGHILMINRQKVEKAEAYFDKHGAISTLIGRLIPAIRQLISIPAGISRMNLGTFALFTTLGAMIWNIVLALLGYWLSTFVTPSALYENIEKYNRYLTWGGYGIALICVGYIVWKVIATRRAKKQETTTKTPSHKKC